MRTTTILRTLLLLPLLAVGACAAKQQTPPGAPTAADTDPETVQKLERALAGEHRSEKNRARDMYRHPLQTLSFFGLRDNMTVLELWPGGGWYTEVLAPVLAEKGKLICTSAGDPNGAPDAKGTKSAKEFVAFLDKNQPLFGKVDLAIINPPDQISFGAPNSVDLAVTFRNLHGWVGNKSIDKVFAATFDVLKPGGVFGLVEHRAKPGMDPKTGYIEEAVAIAAAEKAGFKVAAKSEINANPKDTKDYPDGVWSLPPTFRGGDKDKDKYTAIGESDRMTLKFVKPKQ